MDYACDVVMFVFCFRCVVSCHVMFVVSCRACGVMSYLWCHVMFVVNIVLS